MNAITLNFHGIGHPTALVSPGEMPYWVDTDLFEDIIERFPEWSQEHELYITFDDGNLSDLEVAAPILTASGLAARFFVLSGRLEMPDYLSADDVRELRQMGFIIGSHGQDHVDWAAQSPDNLAAELHRSREVLENILNEPITEAAIPFGSYNQAVLKGLKAAGYTAAWTSDGGRMNPQAFLRPRTSIKGAMSIENIQRDLLGRTHPVRELRRKLAKTRKALF